MTRRQKQQIEKRFANKLAELTGKTDRRSELKTERLNDPDEETRLRQDLDLAVSVINTDWETAKAVEQAMALLETGEYGICQECGEPINLKRLEAIPWTTLCVSCKESQDSDPDLSPTFPRAA